MCILWGDEAENKSEASNNTASGDPSTYPASCAIYYVFKKKKKKATEEFALLKLIAGLNCHLSIAM